MTAIDLLAGSVPLLQEPDQHTPLDMFLHHTPLRNSKYGDTHGIYFAPDLQWWMRDKNGWANRTQYSILGASFTRPSATTLQMCRDRIVLWWGNWVDLGHWIVIPGPGTP